MISPRNRRSVGRRETIARAHRAPGAPGLGWCHDGWAHADGHLLGLDLLDERYEVTAFGWEPRVRGEPAVSLEILPARRSASGIELVGLEELVAQLDVVWAGGSYEPTTSQLLDARRANGPAVVSYDVENIVGNYGGLENPLRRRALAAVDHFCATSSLAARTLELDGVEPERVSVVPPVVELAGLDRAAASNLREEGRSRWGLPPDATVVLFMGRMVWEKGLHTLAGAAAALAQRNDMPSIWWLLAGSGPFADDVRRIAGPYGALERMVFAGELSGSERHLAYAAADVQVLPSNPAPLTLEQFGRVIPEGFAFGLPAIGTASGAIPEVIGDAGIVVAPADWHQLASAVESLTDPGRRSVLEQRARERSQIYSVEAFADRIDGALQAGLERHDRVKQNIPQA